MFPPIRNLDESRLLQKISDQTVYFDRRFHAAFPAATMLADGTILLLFRRAPDHRHLAGAFRPPVDSERQAADFDRVDHLDGRSHLAGLRLAPDLTPLGPPFILPCDGEAADQDANLLRLSDGRLLQSGFCWRPVSPWIVPQLKELGVGVAGAPAHHGIGFVFWGGYVRWSDDDGQSWSERRDLPALPGWPDLVPQERPHYGGAVRGRALELPDGTILQGGYGSHPATGRGMAWLHASTDRGASWECRGVIAEDPAGPAGFVEPALAQTADGRLFAFHRTSGLDGKIAVSVSRDGGRSWEPWRALDAVGHPCDPCPLPDGRILLVWGRRHPPFGIRARLWDPDAEDFCTGPELVIRDDALSPDVGYPWATVLPNGEIAVFYYIVDDQGLRGIAASRIAVSPAGMAPA